MKLRARIYDIVELCNLHLNWPQNSKNSRIAATSIVNIVILLKVKSLKRELLLLLEIDIKGKDMKLLSSLQFESQLATEFQEFRNTETILTRPTVTFIV